MHFRGKDWASLTASPGTHGEAILFMDYQDEDVPVTINICPISSGYPRLRQEDFCHSIIPLARMNLPLPED